MTKLEQAARQGLEALESCNVGNWSMAFDEFAVVEALTALREALGYCIDEGCPHWGTTHTCITPIAEQAEQEPVADNEEELIRIAVEAGFEYSDFHERLIVRHSNGSWVSVGDKLANFANLLAAPQPVQQEPVAVVKENPFCPEGRSDELTVYLPVGTKLYAAPVQTVDLTDDEIKKVCADVPFVIICPEYDIAIAHAVIAAYKEKNK